MAGHAEITNKGGRIKLGIFSTTSFPGNCQSRYIFFLNPHSGAYTPKSCRLYMTCLAYYHPQYITLTRCCCNHFHNRHKLSDNFGDPLPVSRSTIYVIPNFCPFLSVTVTVSAITEISSRSYFQGYKVFMFSYFSPLL